MKTLDELDALHAAATAGEWDALKCEVRHAAPRASGVNYHASRADADFTATAKNNWPAFSARLRAAEAEVANLRHYRDSDLAERERHVERIGALENRLAVEMGALAALTDATATYDHEIVKAAVVWSQAHDGIGGGLDDARQALFEAVERRRALGVL